MKINILYLALILCALNSQAQTSTFPVNGATDNRHTIYAFTNAHIQTDPEVAIENGIMLIQDGVILEIGTAVKIPQSAIIYDLKENVFMLRLLIPIQIMECLKLNEGMVAKTTINIVQRRSIRLE